VFQLAGRELTDDNMTAMDAGVTEEAILQLEIKREGA
jgi:hypothetical protein